MALQSKLLKLKEWLTVPQAAEHFAIHFGEPVTEADVLRLALDGRLVLSVRFVDYATAWPLAIDEEGAGINAGFHDRLSELAVGWQELRIPPVMFRLGMDAASSNSVWRLGDDRVFDLPLTGAERGAVEQRYQDLTAGPKVNLAREHGLRVVAEDGTVLCLLDYDEGLYIDDPDADACDGPPPGPTYVPAVALPPGTVFVVRTSALRDFEQAVEEPSSAPAERPMAQRERTTLLTIIASLLQHANIDFHKASKAAAVVEAMTAANGTRVAARTVENHLKLIPDALDRSRDE